MIPELADIDPLRFFQSAIVEHLKAQVALAGIPIVAEEKGDVMEAVATRLKELGIVIIVQPARVDIANSNGQILDVTVGITISETVMFNRAASGTRLPASALVIRVVKALDPMGATAVPCIPDAITLEDDSGGKCTYLLTAKGRIEL